MMGDLRPEKKNRYIWERALFRRKCISLIAYVCVFFIIVNKKLSDRSKKWLSVSTCGLVVVLAMIFSLAGYKETEVTGQEVSVVAFLPESHNRVTGGQREASIEMNCSRVAEDKNNCVVSADQLENTTDQQANRVVDKPVLLSPVQALLVNNGAEKQSGKAELRTQHLIGVGEESRQNFDSVQSVAGINRAMQNVDEDGQSVTAGAIRSDGQSVTDGAISAAGIQEEVPVSDVSPAAVQADTEKGEEADGKSASAPAFAFDEEKYVKLQGKDKTIFCTNDHNIQIVMPDQTGAAEKNGTDRICYVYGDTLRYCMDVSQSRSFPVPENFYGQVRASSFDAAGNRSEPLSGYFLVENQPPQIRFSQDDVCTAPYTFWVSIAETGKIVSGIREVTCTVNGEPYKITNLTVREKTSLDEDLEVPTRCEFSLPFAEEGDYSIVVTVTDYAGNISTEAETVRITKPELISVFMPEKFAIHIDPQRLAGREQIYSDDITLKNDSAFDVQVTVKEVEVTVRDEVSDTGVKKDCSLYLIAPDTGEKIPLKKGINKGVYSYCMEKGADDRKGKLRFVGTTTEGSEAMWEDSDVMVRVNLGFTKAGRPTQLLR
jgi:hypothetical protein